MDLAEKYRPKTLDEVVNQDPVVNSLKSVLARPLDKIPHAFLFCGHHGCGKTTIAYIVKDMMGCGDMNFEYYNTSNTRGIDTIRDLDKTCRFKPLVAEGEKVIKFYILDECHELTKNAQNALLALLEKPPAHVYFALCTTDPGQLLDTIRSRCHTYTLQSFNRVRLVYLLKTICNKEGIDYPKDIYRRIADSSEYSARNALKILDAVIDIEDVEAVRDSIQTAAVEHKEVIDICRIMLESQYTSWSDLCSLLRSIDAKPEKIRLSILGYLGSVAMNSKSYPGKLISMCSLFSESVMYSGLGGLISLIGLAFNIKDE